MKYIWNEPSAGDFLSRAIKGAVFSRSANFFAMINESGRIRAACAYDDETAHSADIYCAIAPGARLTKRFIFTAFQAPFDIWGKTRLCVRISAGNIRSRRFAEHLGFRYEGTERGAGIDGENLLIYGMLKQECRFIRQDGIMKAATARHTDNDNAESAGIYAAFIVMVESGNTDAETIIPALGDMAQTALYQLIAANEARGISRSQTISQFEEAWRQIAENCAEGAMAMPPAMMRAYLWQAFWSEYAPKFFRNYRMEKGLIIPPPTEYESCR